MMREEEGGQMGEKGERIASAMFKFDINTIQL